MPTVNIKLNLNDRDRAAFAYRMGKPRATYADIVTDLRSACYRLLLDYRHEYEEGYQTGKGLERNNALGDTR